MHSDVHKKRDLHILKRGLQILKIDLQILKRDLHILKRDLYILKRALNVLKRPDLNRRAISTHHSQCCKSCRVQVYYTLWYDLYDLFANEPCIFTENPTQNHTLQHTTTHYNALQYTATHWISPNALIYGRHTTTHYNTLQYTATQWIGSKALNYGRQTATHCAALQHTTKNWSIPNALTYARHSATHCNTLQHSATHWTSCTHLPTLAGPTGPYSKCCAYVCVCTWVRGSLQKTQHLQKVWSYIFMRHVICEIYIFSYGVAMISRLLEIIGLFCRISSLL